MKIGGAKISMRFDYRRSHPMIEPNKGWTAPGWGKFIGNYDPESVQRDESGPALL